MLTMLKSKLHLAHVTEVNIDYEGSITIDRELMRAADILPFEQVHVLDLNNGARLMTYAIEGRPGSGEICLNGATARLVCKGDTVIILSYHGIPEEEAREVAPRLVYLDKKNRITSVGNAIERAAV